MSIPIQVVLSTLDTEFPPQDSQEDCPVKFWYCPSSQIIQVVPLKYLPCGHLTVEYRKNLVRLINECSVYIIIKKTRAGSCT